MHLREKNKAFIFRKNKSSQNLAVILKKTGCKSQASNIE